MKLEEYSVKEFSQILSEKVPVPGGGGAAALVASLGAALSSMVGNYSLSKDEKLNEEIHKLLNKSESIRKELLNCIEEDATGFEPLSKAYKLPKDAQDRDEIMEKCLKDAAATPLKIAELSCEVIALSKEFLQKGSEIMMSDAACSSVLAWSALYAAVINVRVNTKLMKDRQYADAMNEKADALMNEYWKIADEVYESVFNKLK